jgi:hypothetical protein
MAAGQRIAWTWARETWFDPNTNLEPAGLLGPVRLKTVRGVEFKSLREGEVSDLVVAKSPRLSEVNRRRNSRRVSLQ